jgi:hypothetical protein
MAGDWSWKVDAPPQFFTATNAVPTGSFVNMMFR